MQNIDSPKVMDRNNVIYCDYIKLDKFEGCG